MIFIAVVHIVLMAHCFREGSVVLKVGRYQTLKIPFSELKTMRNHLLLCFPCWESEAGDQR